MIRIVIHRPRGMGKTHDIVQFVKKYNGILVTISEAQAKSLRGEYGLKEDQVVSYHSIARAIKGKKRRPVYVDNADYLLASMLDTPIEGITLNQPDRESIRREGYKFPTEFLW